MRVTTVALAATVLLGLTAPAFPEATRTLEAQLTASGEVAVENLAGSMRVLPADGSVLTVRAVVHAESEELAAAVKLETAQDKGVPTLRVRYPDGYTEIRYPGGKCNHCDSRYDGRRYEVSERRGTEVWADLEVRVPANAHAKLQVHVGELTGSGLSGTLRFDTASGDIELKDVAGDLRADTGSGDVLVEGAKGVLNCDTGSGRCTIRSMTGERLDCDTGSGKIVVEDVAVARLEADTGSGDIELIRVDAERIGADTGSGNIELVTSGVRIAKIEADTGSGDIRLGLPGDSGFEAHFDAGSGDLVNRFDDAQAIVHGREVVGYRRGDGRIRIDVDSGSGDLVLETSAGGTSR